MNHKVNNLCLKKATEEYGSEAECAVAKAIQQMISKGVFEYDDIVLKGADVLRSYIFIKLTNKRCFKDKTSGRWKRYG